MRPAYVLERIDAPEFVTRCMAGGGSLIPLFSSLNLANAFLEHHSKAQEWRINELSPEATKSRLEAALSQGIEYFAVDPDPAQAESRYLPIRAFLLAAELHNS